MYGTSKSQGRRIPHTKTVRTGEKPHLQLYRPNEHVPARRFYVEKVIEDDLPTVAEALEELKVAWGDARAAETQFRELLESFMG
jgi:hypothetical protein